MEIQLDQNAWWMTALIIPICGLVVLAIKGVMSYIQKRMDIVGARSDKREEAIYSESQKNRDMIYEMGRIQTEEAKQRAQRAEEKAEKAFQMVHECEKGHTQMHELVGILRGEMGEMRGELKAFKQLHALPFDSQKAG